MEITERMWKLQEEIAKGKYPSDAIFDNKILPEELFSSEALILWAKEALPASKALPDDHDCDDEADHSSCINLEDVASYCGDTYDPDDVFGVQQLEKWADENGWISKEDAEDLISVEDAASHCREYKSVDEVFSDEAIIQYCRDYIDPGDVFTTQKLEQWAEKNGWLSREDAEKAQRAIAEAPESIPEGATSKAEDVHGQEETL